MDCKFIMIPVPMIRRLITSIDAYNELLSYGIYHSATKQHIKFEDGAVKQLVYCYFRQPEALTEGLHKWLEGLEGKEWFPEKYDIGINGDRYGRDEHDFFTRPLSQICEGDTRLKAAILEWYSIYQFCQFSEIKRDGKVINSIANFKNWPKYEGEPYAMINPTLFWEYRDKHPHERDRVRMAMLLAVSSIQGNKRFAGTTKSLIGMRMFGAKDGEQLKEILMDSKIQAIYEQYTTRRMYDGLRNELLRMGLLKCYHGHAGRIYVSTRYTFDELIDEIAQYVYDSTNSQKWRKNEDALNKRLTVINKRTS